MQSECIEGISNLKEGKSYLGTPFAKNTLYDHVRILKTFLIWMIDNEVAPKLLERKAEAKDPSDPAAIKRHDDKGCRGSCSALKKLTVSLQPANGPGTGQ